MKINPQDLLNKGFVVLREVIPPAELEALRTAFETLVDRQRERWAAERGPDDPPGGAWEIGGQPRLVNFEQLIDGETAAAVEFCLGERTLGASRQIMGAEEAVPTGLMMMCNPVKDHGPANWHRDIHPIDQAPLRGLQQDLMANGPGYLQWNIPLYDDDVLWVVPGSHCRANTEQENRQLLADAKVPLPGSVPVALKAGDGVVYTNTILHWGSNYSTVKRRTVHLGYRAFGGRQYPYVPQMERRGDYIPYLRPEYQALCAHHQALYATDCDQLEAVFRAAIAGDEQAFFAALEILHPGEEERLICAILVSKLAYKMCRGDHPYRSGYGGDWSQDRALKLRFSEEEKDILWQRFASLDRRLQGADEYFVPGFQSGPMPYFFESIPVGLDLDEIVAGW